MGVRSRHFDRKPLTLPLTPLVDVVFLLIVFLMLVGTRFETGADAARLPELTLPGEPAYRPPEQLVIDIYAGEDPLDAEQALVRYLTVEGTAAEATAVAESVAAALARSPGVPVLVRADADLPIATARPVLKALREAGVDRIRIAATRPRPEIEGGDG
ncbi:ExbD/TolR family protein [Mucisphaera calidilacus]|uniref:Biopolymer transport protein ExbD/TolR n=1 Tax=Mucisphaera calidilacus TaxID=2527982 RepID=A0A518BUS3_9BACT|nr:biopolymer transporter ExbD [Mucisphaera calidilacus]QDU70716.1 Biopolymer transport protein ExbD/TolR [Mucisphaera calidilacus]